MSEYIEVKTKIRKKRILKTAYSWQSNPRRKVVAVRVAGQYLEDLGFEVGGYMELEVNDDGSITIRPCTPPENEDVSDAEG